MNTTDTENTTDSPGGYVQRLVRRWCARNVVMLADEAVAVCVGDIPHRIAKWRMIPYKLPDGRSGEWWQPWKPVRYKSLDFTHSRARTRLARVNAPNVEMRDGEHKTPSDTKE